MSVHRESNHFLGRKDSHVHTEGTRSIERHRMFLVHTHAQLSPFSVVSTAKLAHARNPHTHTHTHALLKHLSGCVACFRTPSSHELIGKAIKDSADLVRWRNVVFCYLASKLTKPVRSHLADVHRDYIYLFFLLDGLDAGSHHCLAFNIRTILLGVLSCLSDTAQPPALRRTAAPPSYLWGWLGGWCSYHKLQVCNSDGGVTAQ